MLVNQYKFVGTELWFQKATQEDLDKIKELIADCYELLPIMKGENMKERLLEVLDLLNHEKEDLDQLCKDVSFPETRLARSAAMTNRRVREIVEEVLEGIEDE